MILQTVQANTPVYFVADGGRVMCGVLVGHGHNGSDFIPIDHEGRTLAIQRAEAWISEMDALLYAESLAQRRLRWWQQTLEANQRRIEELNKEKRQ